MRNKIFGAIGIAWGGWILFRRLSSGMHHVDAGTAAYQAGYQTGQYLGLAFGALLFLAGLYFFFKKQKA